MDEPAVASFLELLVEYPHDGIVSQHGFHLCHREGDLEVLLETEAEIDVSKRIPGLDVIHGCIAVDRSRIEVEHIGHDLLHSLFHGPSERELRSWPSSIPGNGCHRLRGPDSKPSDCHPHRGPAGSRVSRRD